MAQVDQDTLNTLQYLVRMPPPAPSPPWWERTDAWVIILVAAAIVLLVCVAHEYALGWRIAALRARLNRCPTCGYSLRGNLSGTCPECGTQARDDAP